MSQYSFRAWAFDHFTQIMVTLMLLGSSIACIRVAALYAQLKTDDDRLTARIERHCAFERMQLDDLALDLQKSDPLPIFRHVYSTMAENGFREVTLCINDNDIVDPDGHIFDCLMSNGLVVVDSTPDIECMRSTVNTLRTRIARPK